MRETYQNGNKVIGSWGEGNSTECPRRSPIRRAVTLAAGLALGAVMAFQVVNQPAISVSVADNAIAPAGQHGYRADVIDDIIELIEDLLGGGDDEEDEEGEGNP